MASTLEKKLKAANAAFKKARAAVEAGGGAKGGDFFNEVGRFDTRITDSDVNESQNGRPQGYLEFTITDGEFKGQTFRTYWGLEPDAEKRADAFMDYAASHNTFTGRTTRILKTRKIPADLPAALEPYRAEILAAKAKGCDIILKDTP